MPKGSLREQIFSAKIDPKRWLILETKGSVATFDWRSMGHRSWAERRSMRGLRRQFEELVDELNVTPNISSAHPPNLPLPHHVHRFITLNRSLRRLELSEPLLGVHPAFDRSVVLLKNVVQVLHRSCRQRR